MGEGDLRRVTELIRHAVSAITDEVRDLALDLLDPSCKELIEELRERCPQALPAGPLPPGVTAPPVPIDPQRSSALFGTAFAVAAGAAGREPGTPVVWSDGAHELLVYPAKVRILLLDGFVLVGITIFTEQTGTVEVSVPFAVGRQDAPTGLMIATEPLPRGPALIVERWGDQLIAAAWQALIHLSGAVAAAAGTDTTGAPLIPASLVAASTGLTVLPQAAPAVTAVPPPAGTRD